MKRFEAAIVSAQRREMRERRALACDVRAAMAAEDGFEKYINAMKPKG